MLTWKTSQLEFLLESMVITEIWQDRHRTAQYSTHNKNGKRLAGYADKPPGNSHLASQSRVTDPGVQT